jgi:hypothetical protein
MTHLAQVEEYVTKGYITETRKSDTLTDSNSKKKSRHPVYYHFKKPSLIPCGSKRCPRSYPYTESAAKQHAPCIRLAYGQFKI